MKSLLHKFVFLSILLNTCSLAFAQKNDIGSLLILVKTDKEDTTKINHLLEVSNFYSRQNTDSSIYFAVAAKEIAEKTKNRKQLANAHSAIGLARFVKGDFSKALENHFTALKIDEELNNKYGIAKRFGSIGNVYKEQGDYPKAFDYYLKALKIFEEAEDKNKIATCLANIGDIYIIQGDYFKGLDYHFKALKIYKELGDKNKIAISIGNIGRNYSILANSTYDKNRGLFFSKALDYSLESLKLAEESGNKRLIATMLQNIAGIYSSEGNQTEALPYLFKALKINEELNDQNMISIMQCNIGHIYTIQKQYKEAEKYLLKAVKASESTGSMSSLRDSEDALAILYDNMSNYKQAFIHYKKAAELKDTLFSQENRKQLVRKEMNFEFEKKEALTKAQNEARQKIAEEKNRKQKIITWAVGLGLLLVAVFAGFILRSLRITRKQKKLIEQQKDEVSHQKVIADSQRIIAEEQKHIVEEKQKEIVASITYAKRIQTALLTSNEYIKTHLPSDHFILFKPKDIVSGDFYWAISINSLPGWDMGTNKVKLPADKIRKNTFYMMTADCTGHGVPGAFMSMLNISYLHENIVERGIRLPHDILNAQRKEIIQALNPAGSIEEAKDGMDCILCVYDFDKMLLHFSAANNPLWLVRNGELTEYKADKMPVGKYNEKTLSFTLQTITLQKEDIIYTSTDGFADQFGVNGKKLMKKKFKEELLKIHCLPMNKQKEYLDQFFESWKGDNAQVDDVCVTGIKI
ncbi:MAG: tetratricopeptide repeat protein [Bacteroidota bacterium]